MKKNNSQTYDSQKTSFLASLTIHHFIVYGVVFCMALPIVATLLYSFSASWGATILPDSLTVDWYIKLFKDERFVAAVGRSLALCIGSLVFSTLIVLPMSFVIFYYFPKLNKFINILILLPFAVPPVVSSVGLLQLYSGASFLGQSLVGTPWILVGTYFTIVLPFMYRALANSYSAINLNDLMDAAHLLGASTSKAFLFVVLPNLKKGLLVSLFISFSMLFGEFVFANLLVGTRYETLQVYLFSIKQTSGHFTSALVMTYFFFIFILTWLASRLSRQGA